METIRGACEKIEDVFAIGGTTKDIVFIVISAICLIASLFFEELFPFDPGWIAIVLCGIPIVVGAAIALITEFDIKADLLVSIALVASIAIGEVFAAGEVAVIMQLGALLEELTVARARKGIETLVELSPHKARVIRDGEEIMVDTEEVRVDDILRVLPGENVAVDGVIISGATSIDQSAMTGESLPVDKEAGDEVMSGTTNRFGAFDMRATRVGEDSSIQRMSKLVQSADAGKAKIVRIADRWATWIVVGALTASVLTLIFTGEALRAVTVLVVFCPCALVLATPTAIVAGIGNATKHGMLVREGDALERMAAVKTMAFDKTGTLTMGQLHVTQAKSFSESLDDDTLLALVASAELRSEHPLGKAVVSSYEGEAKQPENFEIVPGRGVSAQIDGVQVLAGNKEMIDEAGVAIPSQAMELADSRSSKGDTLVHVTCDGAYVGLVSLSDTVRRKSRNIISRLEANGLRTLLLTGDSQQAANTIASTLKVDEVKAQCLPEDKLACIDELEQSGEHVCMIGDGVNDAPALKRAHVSIAMGGVGSDIAVDAADIALVNDDIDELPHIVRLARHMMNVIRANLTFSLLLNFLAIVLAITAVLDPVSGALVHNCGSVFVIVNSAFLLRWRAKDA